MLISGIKSRPVYGALTLDAHARSHVFVADGEGALAVRDVLAPPSAAASRQTATLFYTPGFSKASGHEALLEGLGVDALHVLPTTPTLLNRLDVFLQTARMGLRLYAAGTEGLIGQTIALAMRHGIDHGSVVTEHRGSLARRVQCVHCKGFLEAVTVSPVQCSHCGLMLLVRDHYSRRLAAFQGVRIDAEAPGDVPPAEELFA